MKQERRAFENRNQGKHKAEYYGMLAYCFAAMKKQKGKLIL